MYGILSQKQYSCWNCQIFSATCVNNHGSVYLGLIVSKHFDIPSEALMDTISPCELCGTAISGSTKLHI